MIIYPTPVAEEAVADPKEGLHKHWVLMVVLKASIDLRRRKGVDLAETLDAGNSRSARIRAFTALKGTAPLLATHPWTTAAIMLTFAGASGETIHPISSPISSKEIEALIPRNP